MGKDSDSSEVLEEYEEYEEGCAVSLTVAGWTCAGLLLALLLAVLFIPIVKLGSNTGLAKNSNWKNDKSVNALDFLMMRIMKNAEYETLEHFLLHDTEFKVDFTAFTKIQTEIN